MKRRLQRKAEISQAMSPLEFCEAVREFSREHRIEMVCVAAGEDAMIIGTPHSDEDARLPTNRLRALRLLSDAVVALHREHTEKNPSRGES